MNTAPQIDRAPLLDPVEITKALPVMVAPGQVFEVRILDPRYGGRRYSPKVILGYFDDLALVPDALAALHLEGAKGIYITLNPVAPALLARSHNKFVESKGGDGVGDKDIITRHRLLIDVDPIRPAGISSSDDEKKLAHDKVRAVYSHLKESGWPEPIAADSGNGYHLLYRIDQPASAEIVKQCLEALDHRFSDDTVGVDTTVFNPARIVKLYGTLASKGDDCPDLGRPHRLSRLLTVPDKVEIVTEAQLEALAGTVKPETTTKTTQPQLHANGTGTGASWDQSKMQQWIDKHLAAYQPGPATPCADGTKWKLEICPFNSDHGGDSGVIQYADGRRGFSCFHNGCKGHDWQALRAKVDPKPKAPIPAFFYGGKAGYAMESKGRFIPLPNEGQVKAHLLHIGVDKDDLLSRLCVIREENFVAHIGPVAGFPPGLHKSQDSGDSFLVTVGPSIIEGRPGPWPFIMQFFQEMLEDPDQPDQLRSIFAWLHQARLNLVLHQRRPGPAATLVGPRNCGKSLFIEITRLLLGGRVAPALGALNGTTSFNADITGAELLSVDDEIVSRDHRARVGLAQGIKRQLFAGSVRCEAKGRDALSLRPIQALIIAVNDENEHLHVLPPLDDSLRDKISLYQCRKASLAGLDDREEIIRRITEELPAFIYHIEGFNIPSHLADARTGAAAWQHPEVIELLALISPEERLRELLQQCDVITKAIEMPGWWEGTAAEIERLLINDDTTHHAARSLLTFTGAAGTYLSRLDSSGRATVSKRILKGQTRWKITNLNPKG